MKTAEKSNDGPFPLEAVLRDELAEIDRVRQKRIRIHTDKGLERPPAAAPVVPVPRKPPSHPIWQTRDQNGWVNVIDHAHKANLVGLAFSGGGIRSATFNLGVLQALAELRLLSRIDYLSTVSGGGYIGAWLAAWAARRGNLWEVQTRLGRVYELDLRKGNIHDVGTTLRSVGMEGVRRESFADVQNGLATNRVHQEEDNEPRETRFLRVFSSYLTPKLGFFSGDTLTAAAIILRNILLNLTVLVAGLAAFLLLPYLALQAGTWLQYAVLLHLRSFAVLALALVFLAFVVIIANVINLRTLGKKQLLAQRWQILWLATVPLLVAAVLGAFSRWSNVGSAKSLLMAAFIGALSYAGIWLLAFLTDYPLRWLFARTAELNNESEMREAASSEIRIMQKGYRSGMLQAAGWAVVAGALGGWLFAVLSGYTNDVSPIKTLNYWNPKDLLTFAVPLILLIFLLTETLHIGLIGTGFHDEVREWWGRLGGWLLLFGGGWLAVFLVALYFPGFMHDKQLVRALAAKYLTPTWVLTTGTGLWAAMGDSSGKPGELTWKDWLVKATPYIFILGLMCWLSYGINWMLCRSGWRFISHRPGLAWALCAAVAAAMAWRVDINQFSMHLLYRNRLVRCYLGQTNDHRIHSRASTRTTTCRSKTLLQTTDTMAPTRYSTPL